jgi:hypothetical protein
MLALESPLPLIPVKVSKYEKEMTGLRQTMSHVYTAVRYVMYVMWFFKQKKD